MVVWGCQVVAERMLGFGLGEAGVEALALLLPPGRFGKAAQTLQASGAEDT